MEPNRLILCSGTTRRAGWKTLDANPKHEPDFLAVIPPLPASVKAVSWNEIEWVHGITSFYLWDAITLLTELHEILVPHGKLILEQPDFNKAIDHVEWLFGDPLSKNPLHMNRWSYTPESITTVLTGIGFDRIEILPAQYHRPERDFRLEAYR